MKVNKLQTPNFLVQQDCLSCIPDSKGKMFQIPEFGAQAKLPALRNLGSHT